MKRYISILIIALASSIVTTATAQDSIAKPAAITPTHTTPDKTWEQANSYYQKGEYTSAIMLYEELLSKNEHSAEVYYNLGNAYFKNNNLGKSILNFNRALLLDPANEDTQHNLLLAKTRTIDKIEPIPQFFLKTWIIDFGGIMGTNAWTIAALVFLGLTLSGVILWLISSTLVLRKAGFYTALLAMLITLTSFLYASGGYNAQVNSTDAIITNTATAIKSGPDASSKDLFLLHEGTRVTILDQVQGWSQIRIEDGNKGWIQTNAIEKIVQQ